MWELLENATAKRTEQQHFTAAWNREEDLSGNIYGKEIIELHAFTAIGKCQKEAACYLEPAVACYSCDKFCLSIGTLIDPPICGVLDPLKTVFFVLKQSDYFLLCAPRPV